MNEGHIRIYVCVCVWCVPTFSSNTKCEVNELLCKEERRIRGCHEMGEKTRGGRQTRKKDHHAIDEQRVTGLNNWAVRSVTREASLPACLLIAENYLSKTLRPPQSSSGAAASLERSMKDRHYLRLGYPALAEKRFALHQRRPRGDQYEYLIIFLLFFLHCV